MRELGMNAAEPTGTIVPPGYGRNVQPTLRQLKDAIDREYQTTVKAYTYDVPTDFPAQIEARIRAAVPSRTTPRSLGSRMPWKNR